MAQTITEVKKQIEGQEKELKLFQSLYEKYDPLSEEAINLKGKIGTLTDSLTELNKIRMRIEKADARFMRQGEWKKEKPLIDKAIKDNHIGYLVKDGTFIYCIDYGTATTNVQFDTVSETKIRRVLNKLCGTQIKSKSNEEIVDYFEEQNQTYHRITSSFNDKRWNSKEVYNKMSVIRHYWIHPNFTDLNYNPDIDILIASVCGGKEENIEHLEKWVAFKYLNPCKNANIPNLDIGGEPGGNGKGRFVELLKTIFTPLCVVQAHREELEKFNANWEMAVVLYYDEPEERELSASKLKQSTGTEELRIEKKGVDAAMADRNFNFIFLSNNEKGVVKLSGGSDGGEDRRYSVITTDVVLYDALRDTGSGDLDARTWLDNLAQRVIKDRAEIAKWLAAVIKRHNVESMTTLPALHGSDYQKRFDDQKDVLTEAFDRIIPVFQNQGIMPQTILGDLVRVITDNPKYKDRTVGDKFERYMKRQKIDTVVEQRFNYKICWLDTPVKKEQQKVFRLAKANTNKFEYSEICAKEFKDVNLSPPLSVLTLKI